MSPEERAEVEELNNLYHAPTIRPEDRNILGPIGKVDVRQEVDPLSPEVPYTELGSVAANPHPDFDHVNRKRPGSV